LLAFLSQQTGYEMGELAVQATLADDERDHYGGKHGVEEILQTIEQVSRR
jgi:hypothetical protein